MYKIKFLFIIFINVSLYAQADSLIIDDCSCKCMVKFDNVLPDSFTIGGKFNTRSNSVTFGIPVTAIVKFKVTDIKGNTIKETGLCKIHRGSYLFNWGEFLNNGEGLNSGVYKLRMTAFSEGKFEKLYSSEKNFLFVK